MISINLDTKGKTEEQIMNMIDNELNEEIKTNIDVDQLERQLDKLFIDSSD